VIKVFVIATHLLSLTEYAQLSKRKIPWILFNLNDVDAKESEIGEVTILERKSKNRHYPVLLNI